MILTSELRKLRKYHELTCKDMAELIGVDTRTYINKENGTSQFKANARHAAGSAGDRGLLDTFRVAPFSGTNYSLRQVHPSS